jgi:hypothetical protein
MALRFKRTIDVSPHMFSTREHADTDWLLYCGSWQVGRVHEIMRPVEPRIVLVWSLTGPHTPEARVPMRGGTTTGAVRSLIKPSVSASVAASEEGAARQDQTGRPAPYLTRPNI